MSKQTPRPSLMWQATDEMPLMRTPHRDPLEGPIGGTQTEPHDLAPSAQVREVSKIWSAVMPGPRYQYLSAQLCVTHAAKTT